MVQYFGEQLDGFAFTRNGWVQSYGSRCVRPPVIYGDISRPRADDGPLGDLRPEPDGATGQGDADRTGDDPELVVRPRRSAARKLPAGRSRWRFGRGGRSGRGGHRRDPDRRTGAAGRAAVASRGLRATISIGRSPASGWPRPARGRKRRFRPTCATAISARSSTPSPRSTPMCSRSRTPAPTNELLRVFRSHGYDKEIGPGVYDIHSPAGSADRRKWRRTSAPRSMCSRPEQVWVNPDCGLKTRKTDEAHDALVNMVEAAQEVRREIADSAANGPG